MRLCSPAPAGAPGSFFLGFARGQAGGRRPPAEGGHTGKARVGGCAAGPVARPAPGTSYISAASFFSRPSARRSTSAKFVASM